MAGKTVERKQSANLSVQQIQEAMPKLERRIADVEAFEPSKQQEIGSAEASILSNKLSDFLNAIYPPGTIEHNRYLLPLTHLYGGPMVMGGRRTGYEITDGYRKGKEKALAALNSIKSIFEEALEDAGAGIGGAGKAIRAYGGLELHAKIQRNCSPLYRDGHYAEAVEKAVKVLNTQVRLKSEIDLDGSKTNGTGVRRQRTNIAIQRPRRPIRS